MMFGMQNGYAYKKLNIASRCVALFLTGLVQLQQECLNIMPKKIFKKNTFAALFRWNQS